MAQTLAPRIRVNAIGPGPTVPSARQNRRISTGSGRGLIMKRGRSFDEFGRTIRFLFDTPSITGQMIALDGGQHLAWQTPDVAEIVE
jgi:NAD(P)-dependent dehydrogenase (short-subunit alcohol dehydrogenase family)